MKLILNLGAFFLLQILILLPLEWKARTMYRTRTDLFRKFDLLDSRASRISCLALGNSYAAKGIDPAALGEPAFNAAFSTQDLYYDCMILEKYLPRMCSLKVVLVCLDNRAFGHNTGSYVPYIAWEYLRLKDIAPRNGYDIGFLLGLSELWLHKETFVRDALNGKAAIRDLPPLADGYDVPDEILPRNTMMASGLRYAAGTRDFAGMVAHAAGILDGYEQRYRTDMEESNKYYLYRLIRTARERGIRVIVYSPPQTRFYLDRISNPFLENFKRHIARLRADFPGIDYYDFSNLKIQSDYFYNSNHLNSAGAYFFSSLLADSVLHRD